MPNDIHVPSRFDSQPLMEIFERSARENIPASDLADTIARERLAKGETTLDYRRSA